MELLSHVNIKNKLSERSFFDLKINNQRLNSIIILDENPIEKLKELFDKIVTDEKIQINRYMLHNLLSIAETIDSNIVINIIISAINKKNNSIKETISNEDGELDNINLGMYIQIWKSYKQFSDNIYKIVKNYQNHMVDKDIKIGKIPHDIIGIMQISMFYNSIVADSKNDILSIVSNDLKEINKNNVDQLIEYLDSIRMFMIMSDFITVDKVKLVTIIKTIMNKNNVVNIMCAKLHELLLNLDNSQSSSEYKTENITDIETKTIKKIYKLVTLFATYVEKKKLLLFYSKFMQIRIINLKYSNYEMEIELVRRLSSNIGKEDCQKLIDTLSDMINCINANKIIQSANIKVKSNEYKHLGEIKTKSLTPIVLNKNIWKIYNTGKLSPNYPTEMNCYLDIISKSYLAIYDQKYVIDWHPTLGSAQFEAILGSRKVNITCNIMQAMALMCFNKKNNMTINDFVKDTMINHELSEKIFESLSEANIIILSLHDTNENTYVINTHNYHGDTLLDIRKMFIETFNVEVKEINKINEQSEPTKKKIKKSAKKKIN